MNEAPIPILCNHRDEKGKPCERCVDVAIKCCAMAAYAKGFAEGLERGRKIGKGEV